MSPDKLARILLSSLSAGASSASSRLQKNYQLCDTAQIASPLRAWNGLILRDCVESCATARGPSLFVKAQNWSLVQLTLGPA